MTPHTGRIPYLPARIEGLAALAMNLWWSWSREARGLFRSHRPDALAPHPPQPARAALPGGSGAHRRLRQRQRLPPPLRRRHGAAARTRPPAGTPGSPRTIRELDGRPVAYFCAEFGLHSSVPIYSGGLGVLAGDHCKAASDLGVPAGRRRALLHEGLLRPAAPARRLAGGQRRRVRHLASRRSSRSSGPRRRPYLTTVETSGRPVHVRAWRMMVGRVPIYLLDTNLEVNHAGRPRAHEQALRRRPRPAGAAGVDPRRRRRAGAARHGHRSRPCGTPTRGTPRS